MIGQPAKVLRPHDVRSILAWAAKRRHGARNKTMILLSVKAGLRAGEIAQLTWAMVTDSSGHIGHAIELPGVCAKYGSGRRLPMHGEVRQALMVLQRQCEGRERSKVEGPVIGSERGNTPMTAKSVVNWFHAMFVELGLDGCSSHSGRRTFITNAAKMIHRAGGSLRDVQLLAGHRSIQTTQGYIEGDGIAQKKLMRLL